MSATVYNNATFWTCYFGQDAAERMPCEVKINGDNGEIAVSYESEDGYTVYAGNELGSGHYQLSSKEVNGRASLHAFPGGTILEGYWEEGGYKGMWRIELGEVSDTVTGIDASDCPGAGEGTADELDRSQSMDDVGTDSGWEVPMRRYRFPLREDTRIVFNIPEDLTRKEARRLAGFILTLSWA